MRKEIDSRIIEKIRKLLSLAESDNQHEAEIAMERANELILRHNLSAQDISDSDIISNETEVVKVDHCESKWIYPLLIKHFFVAIIQVPVFAGFTPKGRKIWHKKYRFVGEPLNLEVAFYTEMFLRRSYKRLWQEYKAANFAFEKSRQAYYAGLTKGILDKLNTQKSKVENETGLVWKGSAAIEKYIRKTMGELKKGRPTHYNRDAEASNAGREAGRNLELTKALKRQDHASNSGRYLGS